MSISFHFFSETDFKSEMVISYHIHGIIYWCWCCIITLLDSLSLIASFSIASEANGYRAISCGALNAAQPTAEFRSTSSGKRPALAAYWIESNSPGTGKGEASPIATNSPR